MRKHLLRMAFLVIMPLTAFAQSLEFYEGDAVVTIDRTNGIVKQIFRDRTVKVIMTDGNHAGFIREYKIYQLSLYKKCSQLGGTNCHQ